MAFGPPAMGYDRAITIFSPDGKLYQVEYAFEAVRKGWTTIAVKTQEGVVLIAEKRKPLPLIDIDSIEKIFLIDDHVGASFAGFGSDGRILIDYARTIAIRYRVTYGEPIELEYLVRLVCDVKQAYTQHGGVRPFGVALVFAGVDSKGPRLFMTEPSGQYWSYNAIGIGIGGQAVNEFLEKNYKYEISLEEGILLGLEALKKSLGQEKLSPEYAEIGVISVKDKAFRKLSPQEIEEYITKLGERG